VLTVFDDGKLSAGQFGIWTERDGATRFNQVEISPLPTGYELDLQRRSGGRGNRSGMIEDRRAKGVHPRDWALDATGKAVFSDLRNSFIDLVKSHLALRLVTDTARPTPALILLPLAVVSSWAGVRLVQMIDVRNFNTAITIILLGVSLILVCQGVARFREL
jgi:hypothetical protein